MNNTERKDGLYILLIEDSEHDRIIFHRAMKEGNVACDIVECESANEGVTTLLKKPGRMFDVAVVDYDLPGKNGIQFCQEIRAAGNHTPLIILTGAGSELVAVEALRAGVNNYIIKDSGKNFIDLLPLIVKDVVRNHREFLSRQKAEEDLRLKRQELQKLNDENTELLHVLCHDFANPFTSILSSVNLLEHDSALTKNMISHIRHVSNRSLEHIELIRHMVAMKEKQSELTLTTVNLSLAVDTSYHILKNMFTDKSIVLRNDLRDSVMVVAEETTLIDSVLNNIFTNAVKFSHRGSEIFVRVFNQTEETITVSIKDTGIGMPPPVLKNLFKLGSKSSRDGTEGETGSGFGVTLVNRFITAYGGSIEVQSSEAGNDTSDPGTEIFITFQKNCSL